MSNENIKSSNKDASEGTNNPQRRDGRRKLLVGGGVIGASQVLPASWTKTAVNSIILPSHAQTSAATMNFTGMGAIP